MHLDFEKKFAYAQNGLQGIYTQTGLGICNLHMPLNKYHIY